MSHGEDRLGSAWRIPPDVAVPRDVFVRWLTWLNEGAPNKVATDLADLLARTYPAAAAGHRPEVIPPDPPSSATRPISTR
jgi:hypothetical protein